MPCGYGSDKDFDRDFKRKRDNSANYPGASKLRASGINPKNYRYTGNGYYQNKGLGSDAFFDKDGNMHRTM